MKRKLSIICILLVFIMSASSCNILGWDIFDTMQEDEITEGSDDSESIGDTNGDTEGTEDTEGTQDTEDTEDTQDTEDTKDNEGTDAEQCTSPDNHDYVEVSRVAPLALKDGVINYECARCKGEFYEKIPATKSLKILAIGNSFTQDSTVHLWNICNDAGVENVIVANMFIGNSTLNVHWTNISENKSAYQYQKNTVGFIVNIENYSIENALKDEDWDFIVLHQTSGSSGQAETYENLDNIIKYINDNKTNPEAKILWHMPWAYQADSTHAEFAKYDKDQMKMYDTIVTRVNEIILPKKTISAIIPSATAIQNLRTSFVGDNVTRDGYHLDYGFGRYTAALTWYAVLTGGSIDAPDWVPSAYPEVEAYFPAMREAVKAAMASNFQITGSRLKNINDVFDLSDYELLEWNYNYNGWWNCKASVSITYPNSSDGTYNQNICSDRMYSIEELPVGTVFVCDNGWRFRLEQFPTEYETYTGTRHGGCTKPFFILSEEFLNGCTYVAWSVSSYPKRDISSNFDEAYSHVKIYIPKN